jgi:hypothetical protein
MCTVSPKRASAGGATTETYRGLSRARVVWPMAQVSNVTLSMMLVAETTCRTKGMCKMG